MKKALFILVLIVVLSVAMPVAAQGPVNGLSGWEAACASSYYCGWYASYSYENYVWLRHDLYPQVYAGYSAVVGDTALALTPNFAR